MHSICSVLISTDIGDHIVFNQSHNCVLVYSMAPRKGVKRRGFNTSVPR